MAISINQELLSNLKIKLDIWYPQLRVALEKNICREFIRRGECPYGTLFPIGLRLLSFLCQFYLELGTLEAIMRRASWKTAFWNYDESVKFATGQKRRLQKQIIWHGFTIQKTFLFFKGKGRLSSKRG